MKSNLFKHLQYALCIGSVSCGSEVVPPSEPVDSLVNVGSLDLTKYVALGNSLTAGYADGALYPEGQESSYAAILAKQLDGVDTNLIFNAPNIVSGNGFGSIDLTSGDILGKTTLDLAIANMALAGEGSLFSALIASEGTSLAVNSQTEIHNFGVPGARSVDVITPGYGSFNPFFGNFQSSATASILEDATVADGSFFSLWIGNNDVLSYALDGGLNDASDPSQSTTIIDPSNFNVAIDSILNRLSAKGAKGVLLTIPPITLIPYFQLASQLNGGVDFIPLADTNVINLINENYAAYNEGLDNLVLGGQLTQEEADFRKITFVAGKNTPVITDESLTDLTQIDPALQNIRQANANDLFLITALAELEDSSSNIIPGVGVPLSDAVTLTLEEQTKIITAYAAYNQKIIQEASARDNIALVDVRPVFADLFGLDQAQAAALQLGEAAMSSADGVLGIEMNGTIFYPLSLDPTNVLSSLWSTDLVHPNPKGAVLIANEIIRTINSEFGASISTADPSDYTGISVIFPTN